jgi:predicted nucleic acid-binding protein
LRTSNAVVLDASVLVKWVIADSYSERADLLLDQFAAGELEVIAPAIANWEVLNVISRKAKRGSIDKRSAEIAGAEFLALRIRLIDNEALQHSAFLLSLEHQRALYDCLYVALALQTRCHLITADERLVNALSPVYPFVRLL